ncbi:MAG: histidine kinase dimerization/phosphoacceptor domain -containing protein [Tardiphaga sp.]
MMAAQVPDMWSDGDRVAALRRYEILDSAHDADFSDFIQIASDICQTPIAAINLIDGHRHWTLAGVGHGDQELPLDHSICAKAILQSDVMVIPDLSADSRFHKNPLVEAGPKLRFYASAQLETPAGLRIGTVCVLDHVARPEGLSSRQRFTLQALARQIMTQLELRRVAMDLSQGNAARDRLQASLNEKEVLLKEVHHRVKNNLQLISSLLSLQASRIADPAMASLFTDSRNRVRSMAMVHENLYRAGNFAEIEMQAHLESLCLQLDRAYGLARVHLVADSDDVTLDLDRAVSCGLIVNELVSNALKHAFPTDRSGQITVHFGGRGDGTCSLTVADNGIGLPLHIDIAGTRSLGLQLVRDLVEQLDGVLFVDRSAGTRFELTFKDHRYSGSPA